MHNKHLLFGDETINEMKNKMVDSQLSTEQKAVDLKYGTGGILKAPKSYSNRQQTKETIAKAKDQIKQGMQIRTRPI